MSPKSALITVLLWGVIFACVGSAIGATLGFIAPEYYRSVFRGGHSPGFNSLQVGIGLGATQGVVAGISVSIVVLALQAWCDVRSARLATDSHAPTQKLRSRPGSVHVLWGIVTAISVLSISATTFILGGIIGQQQLYDSWTERKLDRLAMILQSEEFDGVAAHYSSAAQVYLVGTLKDNAAHDSLHNKLVVTFGTEVADEMIWRVDIAR